MSKEAIKFLCEINPSFKNMDINNTNTFGGEFLLYCIDKALKQGQSLPIDSVSKCDHEPKRPYKGKYTSCKKCGMVLQMKQ